MSRTTSSSKRRRLSSSELCQDAASFLSLAADPDTGLVSATDFHAVFDEYQAAYLPACTSTCTDERGVLSWQDLAGLFDSLGDDDKDTFCFENASVNGDGRVAVAATGLLKAEKPSDFLRTATGNKASDDRRGYCSFLVQEPRSVSDTLKRLPLSQLPLAAAGLRYQKEDENDTTAKLVKMRHGPCLWIFFGRNGQRDSKKPTPEPLEGRPEHTDSVSHDGTWHFQWSGVKEWHLRPTEELMKRWRDKRRNVPTHVQSDTGLIGSEDGRVVVKCSEGDVLIVNTRLWWHKTVIPPQHLRLCTLCFLRSRCIL